MTFSQTLINEWFKDLSDRNKRPWLPNFIGYLQWYWFSGTFICWRHKILTAWMLSCWEKHFDNRQVIFLVTDRKLLPYRILIRQVKTEAKSKASLPSCTFHKALAVFYLHSITLAICASASLPSHHNKMDTLCKNLTIISLHSSHRQQSFKMSYKERMNNVNNSPVSTYTRPSKSKIILV